MPDKNIALDGPDLRSLVVDTTVAAPPRTVWDAWASSGGIASWWNPPGMNVELRVGGPFELYFDIDAAPGSRGSEGCVFLGYVPGEMISFTWNAPPHLALRESHTWVVITFSGAKLGTHVRLVHTGFGTGDDWDAYMAYFREAWAYVLDLLTEHWR
ncbi:MAG: SRPBCC domain-containing protein [Actinomycetota bacterium]